MKGKRWMAYFMVLALLTVSLGGTAGGAKSALAAQTDTATKRLAGHVHDMSEDCGNELELTFTEWSNPDKMPDAPGNYYLTTDVKIIDTVNGRDDYACWNVPKGITNLCLNGHTIYKEYTYYGGMIVVGQGATLNICDCGEEKGKIYNKRGSEVIRAKDGGSVNLYSTTLMVGGESGILVEKPSGSDKGGCASMNGGTIVAAEDTLIDGDGVKVLDEGCSFTMNGGTICNMGGEGVSVQEGAVTINSGSILGSGMSGIEAKGGVVKLSGDVRVTGSGEQDILLGPEYDTFEYEEDYSDPENPKYLIKNMEYCKVYLIGPLSGNADLGRIAFLDMNGLGYEEYYPPLVTAIEGDGYTVTDEDFKKVSTDNDMYALKKEGNRIQMVLKTYTVAFESNGGGKVNGQVVMIGKNADKPAAPNRTGYTFGGWYKDKACTVQWDFDEETVTEDITLYAGWTANTYTVTYDYGGATGGTDTVQKEVTYGGSYGALPVPEKTDLVFDGWYTERAGGIKVTETTSVAAASDHTLYARWKQPCSHVWEQKADVENHWQQCSLCGEKKEIQPHVEDAGTVVKEATQTEDGIRSYACRECGTAMRTEIIPKIGGGISSETATPKPTSNPTEKPEKPTGTPETSPSPGPSEKPEEPTGTPEATSSPGPNETPGEPAKTTEAPSQTPGQQLVVPPDNYREKTDAAAAKKNFRKLRVRSKKQTKKSITLKWNRVQGADGYKIYGSRSGKKNKYKLLKTVKAKKTSYVNKKIGKKKLKKGCYYKYIVTAYQTVNGRQVPIVSGRAVYAVTAGGSYGVAKSVKVKKAKVTVRRGKSFKIKAKEKKKDKKIKRLRGLAYESSNSKVASVSKKGVIRAKKKGTCKVYVYAQNGVYKTVKVRVRG